MPAGSGTRFAVCLAVSATMAMVGSASPAQAAPRCTDTANGTRLCAGPGHTAISTSPGPSRVDTYPYAGNWAFGGVGIPVIGLGGGGIWIGF